MTVNETSHLLCVDTSSNKLRLALLFGGDRLVQSENEVEKTHGQILLRQIENLFESAGLTKTELNGIVVALGPGSFTGLRIGLSAVKGIAVALNLPVVGVTLLELAAYKLRNQLTDVSVILPYKKGELFIATVSSAVCSKDSVEIVSHDALIEKGDREKLYAVGDDVHFQALLNYSMNIEILDYTASDLLSIGREKLLNGEHDNIETLEPLYLVKSTAEIRLNEKRKN
jgi:tRNA threonylcarbamoyladenosine biosynthesis protein TsaB